MDIKVRPTKPIVTIEDRLWEVNMEINRIGLATWGEKDDSVAVATCDIMHTLVHIWSDMVQDEADVREHGHDWLLEADSILHMVPGRVEAAKKRGNAQMVHALEGQAQYFRSRLTTNQEYVDSLYEGR